MLLGVNVVSAVVSGVFAVVALLDPGANPGITDGVTQTAHLYAAMYAVRALPITAVVLWLAAADRRGSGARIAPVLALAGLAQVGDIAVGAVAGVPMMITGATVAAAIHLTSAWLLRPGFSFGAARPSSSSR